MRFAVPTLALLLAGAPAARSDDAADARALVEKAVKAAGLSADTPAATWKDKGKFTAADLTMEYTGEYAFHGPDKHRFVVTGEFGGMKVVFTMVANGGKAWESAFGKVQEIKGEKLEYVIGQAHHLHTTSLLPLLSDKEFKLATAGEKDVGGKKAAAVKVTHAGKADVTLYFDKTTGLLVRSDIKTKDEFQGWKEVTNEAYYEDYKDVGGRKMFGKLRIVRDGKTMIETAVSDFKPAAKLDPKLFEKP